MLFLVNSLSIFFVNSILSGDNGIMIALVMGSLPSYLRRRATITAAGCAVVVRTAATSCAAQLLKIPLLKCAGGILIICVSVRLFRIVNSKEQSARSFETPWSALAFVISADLLMSTDNIVAVASIAQGRLLTLFTGLALSIPLVFFASRSVCNIIGRYPALVYIGAAVLGMLGGNMIVTDGLVAATFQPDALTRRLVPLASVVAILTAGRLTRARSNPERICEHVQCTAGSAIRPKSTPQPIEKLM